MTKQLFLNELSAALHGLPREERYRTLRYYDELIDDRMEDGQSEEEAVSGLGEPEQVAREILGEEEPAPSTSKGRKVWLIVLLVLGFPLWGSLLLVAAIVLMCLYICLFLPAPFLIWNVGLLTGGLPAGLFQLGLSVALLGLAVLSALGFYFTGRATVKAAKAIWRGIRRSFSKKGRVPA